MRDPFHYSVPILFKKKIISFIGQWSVLYKINYKATAADFVSLVVPETQDDGPAGCIVKREIVRRFVSKHLTPYSRVLLEKVIITQLVNKFPIFYFTRKSITVFTKPATAC
jgi:hypothetical protein